MRKSPPIQDAACGCRAATATRWSRARRADPAGPKANPPRPISLAGARRRPHHGRTSSSTLRTMQDTARRHDLDWVRIAAFALLIVYHVGMYYVSWGWHVKSPLASPAIEPLMMLSSPWRLSLLFFVSGTATAFLMRRRPDGFAAGRSKRLLIPLLFGMLVLVTPQAYYEVVEKLDYAGGYLAFWGDYLRADASYCIRGSGCLKLPTWNHLWFVAYLWVYSMLLWALVKTAPRWLDRVSDKLSHACAGVGVLAWPIALVAIIRMTLVARFPSTHALVGDWYNHALFASIFLL